MKKIIVFVKNYWIPLLVILASILSVINLFIKSPPQATPSATHTPIDRIASYKSILPGISTEADLTKTLGTPLKTIIKDTEKTDEYKSTSELRRHIAVVQSEKVVFIKEIVSAHDTTTATDITSIYGTAPDILYSKLPNSTFNLYVYLANGIAYLGHRDGTLLEIWYFQPTTLDIFLTTWAIDYSLTPPTEVLQ